jgi:(p)ppGpp synthase/HD superfamily hydrolase
VLSPRFVEAVNFAIQAHGYQRRKGGDVTYVAHLLAVASLVLEAGGDEELAIAGLLHDTIEDTDVTRERIEAAFGPRVATVVVGCSDSDGGEKAPWRERKERYLAHLGDPETSTDVLIVSRADKLHNARSMVQDYRAREEGLASRFNAGPEEQQWYYETLAGIFAERLPGSMTDELVRTVGELSSVLPGET